MCGIIGGITYQDVGPILLQGLQRLEYRGYDSAGIAIITPDNILECKRIMGKVKELTLQYQRKFISGGCGLAHTRWATHGVPSELNAHPHVSCNQVAVVHNGIIENYESLRADLIKKGYQFNSETDSEVIAHLIHFYLMESNDIEEAAKKALKLLEGMYSIGVISSLQPGTIVAARSGSPLVIGLGENENYIASDTLALLPITNRFIVLEEGDLAIIKQNELKILDKKREKVERKIFVSKVSHNLIDRGKYSHYMEKEIFEQPNSASAILEGRIYDNKIFDEIFGVAAPKLFPKVENIILIACGTSFYAALVARYWLEEIAGISCQVEIASEYRYRHPVIKPNTLFVAISQSGETADTLAAFRLAKEQNYLSTLAICNVAESSLVREADLVLLTHAGPEIGVASTKSFTTQLIALLMLTVVIGKYHKLTKELEQEIILQLREIPSKIQEALDLSPIIKKLAQQFLRKEHALFLGRGNLFPVAMEGALKLKEITYIHAEAYPAGELKHGPLALVDENMPIVVVAHNNDLYEKLKSNLEEVKARGGKLIIFSDMQLGLQNGTDIIIVNMPEVEGITAPIIYVIPLQLLAYYVGVLKGTDVDQPRHLAKSVTVE